MEDNLIAIVCETISPVKHYLDKLVLIPEWNFVPSCFLSSSNLTSKSKDRVSSLKDGHTGYIEIIGECAVIENGSRSIYDNKPLEFLTIQDFQQDRSSTGNLNICGNIFSLSPVHSLSVGKPFFLVKLSCPETNLTISVVVQGAQFMFWHNFLQIDEAYVFQKLRETTMNKGTRNERKVLATTRHSDFQKYQPGITVRISRGVKRSCADDVTESKRPRIANHLENFSHSNSKERFDLTTGRVTDEKTCDRKQIAKPPANMSYTGVITKCINPEAGVFELDSKIRLYISHQPSSNLGRGLRVGAHVTVHNVHLCREGKKVLGFCCCTQSTVRVIRFSPLSTPWKPFIPCESPLALLGQNLTLADYVHLLEMCDKVLEKFSPLYRTGQLVAYSSRQRKELMGAKNVSVLEQLLTYVKNQTPSSVVPARNIYDEFFEVPHKCHPNEASEFTFPWFPTIKEFLDTLDQKSSNKPWLSGQSVHLTASTQEKKDWMYKILTQDCFDGPVILAGCLRSSTKTGQLFLLDQTGEISCIVAPAYQKSGGHDCTRNCCRKFSTQEECSVCPYMHMWHLDALIQINKFEVVIEKFQPSNTFQGNFTENSTRLYLQFSLESEEILIPEGADKKVDSEKRKSDNKKEKSKIFKKDECLDKQVDEICDRKSEGFMCKMLFMVRNCEAPTIRKVKEDLCFPCGVEIKIVAVHRSDVQNAPANNSSFSLRSVSCSSGAFDFPSDFKLWRKNAALKLVKKRLYWSQVLYPGCFYVITETVPNEASSRILKDDDLEPLINVSSAMELERVCWCERCGITRLSENTKCYAEIVKALDEMQDDFFRNDKLCSVDIILGETGNQKMGSDTESLQTSRSLSAQVSFRGVIVSRELRQSETPTQQLPDGFVEVPKFGPVKLAAVKNLQLGFTLLRNTIIQLRVKDLQSPNTMSVYMDLRRSNYVCGILPGAIVQFRRFMRKFSRTKNMYCTFEACSSVVVERRAVTNFTDVPLDPRFSVSLTASASAEENTKDPPNRHLIDLIRSEAQGNFVQTISRVRCRVTAVQKVNLRWLCKRCGELVTRNDCTGGCYGSAEYRFNAEARCVVEDGTGEAQMYVYDDMVPTVLKLSTQQWHHLQDLAMRTGELLYQRHWRGRNNPPEVNQGNLCSKEAEAKMTLENHCCSSRLHRLVILHCKLFRFSKNTADRTEQGYETRSINIGSTEHSTLVLPKLLLRAVSITDVRAADEIRQLLQAVQNAQT